MKTNKPDLIVSFFFFFRMSGRKVSLYRANNVAAGPIASVEVDASPSILVPHYDEDTSTLFLSGKVGSELATFRSQTL